MRTEFVKMIHPDLPGQVYKAPKQGVGTLKRSGWKLAPPEPPTAPEQPTEAPADAGASSSPDNDQPPQRRRASEKKGE